MHSRSISREIALLVLGQISYKDIDQINSISLDDLLGLALETLMNHWREELDDCGLNLEIAQQKLVDVELEKSDDSNVPQITSNIKIALDQSENIINSLSDILELTRLLSLSDQKNIRFEAHKRLTLVIKNSQVIDVNLNNVMEGWRLKRLPRIDQDILRLSYIDIYDLKTPIPVACNEAVNLANRYSDEQGRKMINGILRRLQSSF